MDVVHKHLPFIDTANFIQNKVHSTTHQCQALTHAVAMAGAGARDTTRHLEQQCYMAARSHLEMAETYMDGSSFLTLETAQALILVVRFEFTNTQTPRALITMTRLMRLIRLLMFDRLDRLDTEGSSPKADESRRTFWTSFAMHCHETTIFEDSDEINMGKVRKNISCAQIALLTLSNRSVLICLATMIRMSGSTCKMPSNTRPVTSPPCPYLCWP